MVHSQVTNHENKVVQIAFRKRHSMCMAFKKIGRGVRQMLRYLCIIMKSRNILTCNGEQMKSMWILSSIDT